MELEECALCNGGLDDISWLGNSDAECEAESELAEYESSQQIVMALVAGSSDFGSMVLRSIIATRSSTIFVALSSSRLVGGLFMAADVTVAPV